MSLEGWAILIVGLLSLWFIVYEEIRHHHDLEAEIERTKEETWQQRPPQ